MIGIKSKIIGLYNSIMNHVDQSREQLIFSQLTMMLTDHALHHSTVGVSDRRYFESGNLIVSLTTYGDRLYHVYLTIESLLAQTYKPNKIILWLSSELQNQDLSEILKNQVRRGLEIRYCKDIRSYKKLIPALKQFPNDYIITVDDDVVYHYDFVENLVRAYQESPGNICSYRVRRVATKGTTILPYHQWEIIKDDFTPSKFNLMTGVGGVLYFPHCFNEKVFNEDVFLDICKYADDIWFYSMALLNDVKVRPVRMTHHNYFYVNTEAETISPLAELNIADGLNDQQLLAVFNKYNLSSRLFTS